MSSMMSSLDWSIARAGGIVAYLLLTMSVITGLMLTLHWQSRTKWPRLINSELHNFISLLSLIFTIIHIGAVLLDPYIHFSVGSILIPFISPYRNIWIALGIIQRFTKVLTSERK
jgi:uncharacterized protein involved in cysteine biosynthesis